MRGLLGLLCPLHSLTGRGGMLLCPRLTMAHHGNMGVPARYRAKAKAMTLAIARRHTTSIIGLLELNGFFAGHCRNAIVHWRCSYRLPPLKSRARFPRPAVRHLETWSPWHRVHLGRCNDWLICSTYDDYSNFALMEFQGLILQGLLVGCRVFDAHGRLKHAAHVEGS